MSSIWSTFDQPAEKIIKFLQKFLQKCANLVESKILKMLQNASRVAKSVCDTAENEHSKVVIFLHFLIRQLLECKYTAWHVVT